MSTDRPTTDPVETLGGREHVRVDALLPREARNRALDAVLDALRGAGVACFVSRGELQPATTVGVLAEHREQAVAALAAALPGPGRYLQESYPHVGEQPVRRLTAQALARVPERCTTLRVATFWSVAGGTLTYGMQYAANVQFWTASAEGPDLVEAPDEHGTTVVVDRALLAPATVRVDGRERASAVLFDRAFMPDVTFPIDVVYTWVDGADPAWRERFERARAEAAGVGFHPEAVAANRYESRDELRYSLRSLEMYAPWVRHVYVVTDQQVPSWLDTGNERVTVVDHRDIFRDPQVLPVFNSSAIISQLHHIEGLSEHYLYLNDDVFFGADVRPEDFFHGSGIAKAFAVEVVRQFAPVRADDAPHFTISKNIREFLQRELGRSITFALKHTPYPQLRSVLDEIEQRYPQVVAATAANRFRHSEDIALDQLFHYYAQVTGRAVPDDTLSYDYVNVGVSAGIVRLRRLLATRAAQVFCLNDAPEPGTDPTPNRDVAAFLAAYFPMASAFEHTPGR